MTDKGDHGQNINKEVQHSKTQAIAMSRRGSGQRELHNSPDRLDRDQMELFARMRNEGAKLCVKGGLTAPHEGPSPQKAFLTARLAKGREVARTPDFDKMPRVAKSAVSRSLAGGHIELFASHADKGHHFYGLSERGLAVLAKHETARRRAAPRKAATQA